MSQLPHWDAATAGVVEARLGPPPALRFFSPAEEATATALLDLLLGQDEEPRVPVTAMIDARLAEAQTDGWRYADMAEDGQAWQDTLAYLDADAEAKYGAGFAECPAADQRALIQAVQDLGSGDWHGLPASRVWGLWTRYACTAFYAHPWAWNEMGFPGPPTRAATRTRAWDGGNRSRCPMATPLTTRCGRASEQPGPSSE